MTSIKGNSQTMSGYAPDDSVNDVLGLCPDLDQGVSELLDCLWWYLVALDA